MRTSPAGNCHFGFIPKNLPIFAIWRVAKFSPFGTFVSSNFSIYWHCENFFGRFLARVASHLVPNCDGHNLGGGWMKTHEIPGDKSRVDRSFEPITDRNNQLLMGIAQDPSSGLVNKYYTACMDTAAIEDLSYGPVIDMWNKMSNSANINESLGINLALLFSHGLSGLYEFGTEIDSSNPKVNIYSLRQGGLSLPDPAYYTDAATFKAFVTHIENMFSLAGVVNARADAIAVANFEAILAFHTVPDDELFDPFVSFNLKEWSDVLNLAPYLYFDELGDELDLDFGVDVTLDAPIYFSRISSFVGSTPGTTVNKYIRWRILHGLATRLSSAFVNENFNFYGKVLSGLSTPTARAKTCVSALDSVIPELIGRLYVEKAFPASSKLYVEEMMNAIIATFEVNVGKLTWMDSVTAQKAIDKLEQIMVMVGYPNNPRNYTAYNFDGGYLANSMVAYKDQFARSMQSAGKPSIRDQWEMPANTVNAYYSPTTNAIAMIAGIIQAPFFDINYPAAMNHGGIGLVAGHELSHSLDSQGRNFNGQGKLENWWAPSTAAAFQKRVDCIIRQYSKFSPLPGFYVNGNLTQGENIADAGGLKTAHGAYMNAYFDEAYKPSIVPGLTNEQLLFVGYGQAWCSKLTPAAIKQRLLTDPHSPPRFRVNGACMNNVAFANAFKCPVGSPMNPPERCEVW